MSDECPHRDVAYGTVTNARGLTLGFWSCLKCGLEFVPATALGKTDPTEATCAVCQRAFGRLAGSRTTTCPACASSPAWYAESKRVGVCASHQPDSDLYCTLPKGHDGEHEAWARDGSGTFYRIAIVAS